MLKNDIGCLPVVDANGEISGILTQNDVFNAFLEILGYREAVSYTHLAESRRAGNDRLHQRTYPDQRRRTPSG